MELLNKTIIITGASSGIGEAAALLFAAEGANVVLAFHEDIAQLTTLAQGVADAAANVSENAQGLGQATLTQDLASAEGALGAVLGV